MNSEKNTSTPEEGIEDNEDDNTDKETADFKEVSVSTFVKNKEEPQKIKENFLEKNDTKKEDTKVSKV